VAIAQAVDLDPSQLAASVTGRIPTRSNATTAISPDVHQASRRTATRRCSAHARPPELHIALETEYDDVREESSSATSSTRAVDGFHGERFGPLPYRRCASSATTVTAGASFFQPVTKGHYPTSTSNLRITEFRHLGRAASRLLHASYEFPADDGDPYYPSAGRDRALYKRYERWRRGPGSLRGPSRALQYLNMDQVVGQALATFEKLRPRLVERDATLRPRPR